MWREISRGSVQFLIAGLSIVVFFGFLFELGVSPGVIFALVALGVALKIIGHFVELRFLRAEARDAFATLGPDAAPPLAPPRRLSPHGRAIWPAALRLDRAWRERARSTEAGLAAAEAVLSAMPNPLILLDERRRIVRANKAAAAFVGEGEEPRDLASALRNPALLEAVEAVLHGAGEETIEFVLFFPVERRLRARIARIEPLRGALPRAEGDRPLLEEAAAVLALYDITEIRRAEAMRVDFIANASHELKTPLSALIGFIETLQGPARADREARERFLAIMQKEASRMARLVADLLSLSRIELNEHVAPEGRVAIVTVLREAADALALRAGDRGMRILLNIPAELPEVTGDADEIAQVFHNLLDNAIKYGRAGTEIEVAAEVAQRMPRAGAGVPAPYVKVAVKDQGEGVPREHLPRLTERFYRVDTARSRELGGTGLGLAIVKHVINRHRGFLEIASEPEKGSVFTVYFPQAGPAGGA